MRLHWLVIIAVLLLAACSAAPSPDQSPVSAPLHGDELPGRLLFSREGGVWLWEGRTARQLIAPPATQPAFDPRGERIVYVAARAGASDLWVADGSGAMLAQLTRNDPAAPPGSIERVYAAMWAFYPVWLPDGSGVLAAAQAAPPVGDPPADAPFAIFRYALNGQRQPVFADANAHIGRIVVLPSDELIAVRTVLGSEGQQQLYRIAGGQAEPLPGAPTPAYDPAVSPDGKWVVFAVGINGGSDLYTLPAAGGSPVRITDLGTARAPVFSPDGTLLAFLAIPPGERGFDLYLATVTVDDTGLRLGPSRRLSTGFAINPDAGLSWTR
ncbi:TolB family protein [Chloroflexus aggregans]|uniref:WD40 domain protein beta Propeller n=1 Tax=Chloroflexus aggregans (strain MD-66 / DSM 9485) TaxID=326427 RepID=B8G964_CHLAD|nr:PD40 domain-containing protein [Chloroflexus aggregans]ACL24354.1 WD40 domain protein beta Propeller [Chloroflexus aggregans DSM 9485]